MNWIAIPFRWLLAAPARWMGNVRGFLGWSLQLRVAVILFVFLLLCIFGYYIASWNSESAVADPKADPRFIVSWLVLLIAIPIAAYYSVRAWLETEPSQYPDLDEAWSQGLAAVAKAGVSLDACPLFLATGVASPREADNLMAAVGWDLLVDGQPTGKCPLRWYASREAVVVYLLDASAASFFQRQVEETVPPSSPVAVDGGARGTLIGGVGGGGVGGGGGAGAGAPLAAHLVATRLRRQGPVFRGWGLATRESGERSSLMKRLEFPSCRQLRRRGWGCEVRCSRLRRPRRSPAR